ncbi:MAG: PAS domain S-box protein [Acidobacteria bacterium]|nr:PAS domain S-box protein [Acidobacteriota bacterium]MBI3655104.1 PAS domain S-box protein [Acidobacteriota bacterium]
MSQKPISPAITLSVWEQLFRHVGVGLAISNTVDSSLLAVNYACAQMHGYAVEEVQGKSLADLFAFETRAELAVHVQRVPEKGPYTYESFHIRKDGSPFPVLNSLTLVTDAYDKVTYSIHSFTDITERARLEKQLEDLQEQHRLMAFHMGNTLEDQRRQISREVHDEFGQPLTALKMDVAWLVDRLPDAPSPIYEKTQSMLRLIDATIKSIGLIAGGLRPGVLDYLGLRVALEQQAREFQDRTNIECSFRSDRDDVPLDAARSIAVFRIVQEALINIGRHGQASRVAVALYQEKGEWILEVVDNGRGISEAEIDRPDTLGLIGIRERAVAFGWTVQIQGEPGRGTTIRVRMPLQC